MSVLISPSGGMDKSPLNPVTILSWALLSNLAMNQLAAKLLLQHQTKRLSS
jgi:hypothetical protein